MKHRTLIIAACALLSGMAGVADASVMGYSVDSSENLVRIDLNSGVVTTIGATGIVNGDIHGLAFAPDGTLFGADDNVDKLYTFNLSTGSATEVGSFGVGNVSSLGLAFNSKGTLYMGVEVPEALYTVNTATGAATFVVDPNGAGIVKPSGIAFASNDTLYAVDDNSNRLVTINPTTGATSFFGIAANTIVGGGVGDLVQDPGLDFDGSGTLWMIDQVSNKTWTVNTTTGVGTPVANLPSGGFKSLAIPLAAPEPMTLTLLGIGLAGMGLVRRR